MFYPQDIASVGRKSEFLLLDHISEIQPKKDYIVIKTPSNPKHVSANFILFKNPPYETPSNKWAAIFQEEFQDNTNIKHIKLVWDTLTDSSNLLRPFLKAGFDLEHYRTLLTNELLIKPNLHPKLEVKIISDQKDWESVIQDQMLLKPEGLTNDYYKEFSTQLIKHYQSVISLGKAIWFGAFLGSEMVGSAGLLWSDNLVAFQRVVIKKNFQKQGFSKTMIYYISQWILEELKISSLVVLAEKDSLAESLYQSLGFEIKEELVALYRYPK